MLTRHNRDAGGFRRHQDRAEPTRVGKVVKSHNAQAIERLATRFGLLNDPRFPGKIIFEPNKQLVPLGTGDIGAIECAKLNQPGANCDLVWCNVCNCRGRIGGRGRGCDAGIKIDRLQTKGKRLTVRLTNFTGDDKDIVSVDVEWPSANGDLKKVWLTQGGTSWVIWSGADDPTDAILDVNDPGWNGATLLTGEGILRFDFANKVKKGGYTVRVNFTDGTFLDITR